MRRFAKGKTSYESRVMSYEFKKLVSIFLWS